jgi:hypothetical protein
MRRLTSVIGTNAKCRLRRAMSEFEGKAEDIYSHRVLLTLTQLGFPELTHACRGPATTRQMPPKGSLNPPLQGASLPILLARPFGGRDTCDGGISSRGRRPRRR